MTPPGNGTPPGTKRVLGGFVIHGNAGARLSACLDSLGAVCDRLVTVDSGSTDGSLELARKHGAEVVRLPWQGYGAARAAAMRALQGCDHVLFLDSDEWLAPEAIAFIQDWRRLGHRSASVSFRRRDWVLGERPFVYRNEWRRRIVETARAVWTPQMIVHEALPPMEGERAPVFIEHAFVEAGAGTTVRSRKELLYAALWALQASEEGRRRKSPRFQYAVRLVRDLVLKGALVRGGTAALPVARSVAGGNRLRYALLRRITAGGAFDTWREHYRAGRLPELFAAVNAWVDGAQHRGGEAAELRDV